MHAAQSHSSLARETQIASCSQHAFLMHMQTHLAREVLQEEADGVGQGQVIAGGYQDAQRLQCIDHLHMGHSSDQPQGPEDAVKLRNCSWC